jgi:DMSO/TMAO reductase YedYZ molybdopterin-dependent catalytic subunit
MTDRDARRGFLTGAVAGVVVVAGNYLLDLLAGLAPLPELLQQPLLAAMPGPVFGLLIDTLQHAGKVLEELGLIVAMVAALALLGTFKAALGRRFSIPFLGMLIALAGWLAVTLALLPLSGKGLLGLADGITVPLLWALLFAVYGFLLDAIGQPSTAVEDADPRRRRLLTAPFAIAGLATAFLALRLIPGWYRAIFEAPEEAAGGPSPAITPVDRFYIVSKNFSDPVVSGPGWRLTVHGKVERAFSLTLDQFRALPAMTETVTLECVSNNVGGALMSTGVFSGPSLRDLVVMASPAADADAIAFRSRDGYTETIPLAPVLSTPEILVAHSLDGAPLPDRHGYPARIVLPGRYGMRGPKWLEDIELVRGDHGGFWEAQGWDHAAVVKTTARFDSPRDGQTVRMSELVVAGVAFAGSRGISAIEISADGGRTWSEAEKGVNPSPLSWTLWTFPWSPGREGAYTLVARARDGSGALQTAALAPSFPNGSSGYHVIHVNVRGG